MFTFTGDIQEGMEVIGLDGVSLGTVGGARAGREADPGYDFAKGMPPPPSPQGEDYFLVHAETDELHVPVEAILILFPGQTVTVGYTADECRDRYK